MIIQFSSLKELHAFLKKLYDKNEASYYKMYVDGSGSFWKEGNGIASCEDEIIYDFQVKGD
jgi:hypothetical protein